MRSQPGAPASREMFTEHAAKLFEVAQAASSSGTGQEEFPGDWDILIAENGSIHMMAGAAAGAEWSLDSLRLHHGACMAYRVRQLGTKVRLEGRAGSRTCLFEETKPEAAKADRTARLLLAQNQLFGRAFTLTPLPANIPLLPPAA